MTNSVKSMEMEMEMENLTFSDYDSSSVRSVNNKTNDDDEKKEPVIMINRVVEGGFIKNHVVDYGKLRRSGFFLGQGRGGETRKLGDGNVQERFALSSLNLNLSLPEQNSKVLKWLNATPDDTPSPTFPEETMTSEHYVENPDEGDPSGSGRGCEANEMYSKKKMSEEDDMERSIVESLCPLHLRSGLAPVLNGRSMEIILNYSNNKIDEYLEKVRGTPEHFEFEYVSGRLDFSPSSKGKSQEKRESGTLSRVFMWVKRWGTLIGIYGGDSVATTQSQQQPVASETLDSVVIEPYHGPVFLNGARIKAGATGNGKVISRKGVLGSLVEEIKTVLKAVHLALHQHQHESKRNPPAAAPPKVSLNLTSSSTNNFVTAGSEDTEIQRLSNLLESCSRKKSTHRTIFHVKNAEVIPPYNLNSIRRRRRHHSRRRNLLHAINVWIHARVHHIQRAEQDRENRDVNVRVRTNRVSPGVEQSGTGTNDLSNRNVACRSTDPFPILLMSGFPGRRRGSQLSTNTRTRNQTSRSSQEKMRNRKLGNRDS